MTSASRNSNIFSEQINMRMRKPERIKYRDRMRISMSCTIAFILLVFLVSFFYGMRYLIKNTEFEEHHGHSLESLLNEGLPPHPKYTAAPTGSPTTLAELRPPRSIFFSISHDIHIVSHSHLLLHHAGSGK